MVFTHIPAVAVLFILPLLSSPSLAAILWLIRGFFSLMDVPTKQSYTMAIVSPEERSAMAGLQGVGQNLAGTISPFLSVLLWNTFSAWVPFFLAGTLKALYLSSLYFQFRKIPAPEEKNRVRSK
jgi:predicted MFS family arabinose efflux permease